ncbi:MAG: hypothetical protein GX757_02615 [Clostridiales bacterium]|nr:hypothetical protein [Clostridiales bacterium]
MGNSQLVYAIFYGLLFTVIIGAALYFRIFQNKRKFEYLDFFLITLALFNGLGFAFVFWGTKNGLNSAIWTNRIERYDAISISIYFAANILLMTAVVCGWTIAGRVKRPVAPVSYSFNECRELKKLYFMLKAGAWLMLAVAFVSYVLYARAYGGFSGLLYYAKVIRSGILLVNNPFSFLQRFGAFAFIASFIFFALLIDKNLKGAKRKDCIAGFIMSLCFSLFVLYSWDGRVAFMVYLLVFLLSLILYRNKSVIRLVRKLAIVVVFGLILIVAFDRLLNRSPVGISVTSLFVRELSFPSAAFITWLGKDSFRWFKDILIAPIYLLPSRIWRYMLGLDTASMLLTYDFWGAYKGEAGVTGSVPVDLLTFSYMQAHIAGVVIVGLLVGAILYGLQQLQGKLPLESIRAVVGSDIILNLVILTVPYGEPYHILTRCFYLIVGLILLFIIFVRFRAKYIE